MMRVLLLLVACVCLGLSDDSYVEDHYGKLYRLKLHRKAHSLEFSSQYNSQVKVLWKRGESPAIEDKRRRVTSLYYELSYLTQEDSGRYTMRDKDQKLLSTKTIEVIENTQFYDLSPGESLSLTFDLETISCNIYFFPESDLQETEIVRNGWLQRKGSDEGDCVGFQLLKPCGIFIESLQMSCRGRFEVRDHNGNMALVASLEMQALLQETSYLGIGSGVFLVVCLCICMRHCCCGESSSKEDISETEAAAAEPAAHHHEYDHEPIRMRPNEPSQPSETRYRAQPSYRPTGPLVHNPTVNVPPAYSEVADPAEQADAPTFPFYSDPEPRFELKGITFTSDSAEVYTSDKLNFI